MLIRLVRLILGFIDSSYNLQISELNAIKLHQIIKLILEKYYFHYC